MKFGVENTAHYAVLSLQEENLNSLLAPDLKSEFIILHNKGAKNLILDLSEVKYVDSSGLSAILTANRLWKESSFVLTGVEHDAVKRLIDISQLDNIINIIPTKQESIDFVMLEEVQRSFEGEDAAEGEE